MTQEGEGGLDVGWLPHVNLNWAKLQLSQISQKLTPVWEIPTTKWWVLLRKSDQKFLTYSPSGFQAGADHPVCPAP